MQQSSIRQQTMYICLTTSDDKLHASIWIHQFLKALQDEEGKPLDNAHILGFFRRVCKLLHHGIRPIFVYDGATPTINRITVVGI